LTIFAIAWLTPSLFLGSTHSIAIGQDSNRSQPAPKPNADSIPDLQHLISDPPAKQTGGTSFSPKSQDPIPMGPRVLFITNPFEPTLAVKGYAKDVDATVRKLSYQLTEDLWNRAVVDGCELYFRMATDPLVSGSELALGKQRKLRAVLKSAEAKLRKLQTNQSSPLLNDTKQTVQQEVHDLDPLGNPIAAVPKINDLPPSLAVESQRSPPDFSDDWALAYQLSPGPGQILWQSGGSLSGNAGGSARGEASNLIALIQSTVTPSVWDVNGGSATIQYYQRVHALVIRAPWTTHGQTGQLINGLR